MTEISVDTHGDSVTIIIKSEEVFKNAVIILSKEEAKELAGEIAASTMGQMVVSD